MAEALPSIPLPSRVSPRPATGLPPYLLPHAARHTRRRDLRCSHPAAASAEVANAEANVRLASASPQSTALHVVKKRRVGGFRGGIFGFFIGVVVAGSTAVLYHVDEYRKASAMLLNAVDEMKMATEKVREYASRIEQLQKDLTALQASSSTKEVVGKLREELKRLYSERNVQHLELKSHVWGIEQDLAMLLKAGQNVAQ